MKANTILRLAHIAAAVLMFLLRLKDIVHVEKLTSHPLMRLRDFMAVARLVARPAPGETLLRRQPKLGTPARQ